MLHTCTLMNKNLNDAVCLYLNEYTRPSHFIYPRDNNCKLKFGAELDVRKYFCV